MCRCLTFADIQNQIEQLWLKILHDFFIILIKNYALLCKFPTGLLRINTSFLKKKKNTGNHWRFECQFIDLFYCDILIKLQSFFIWLLPFLTLSILGKVAVQKDSFMNVQQGFPI